MPNEYEVALPQIDVKKLGYRQNQYQNLLWIKSISGQTFSSYPNIKSQNTHFQN